MLRRACPRTIAPEVSSCWHSATQAVVSWSSWNLGLGCRLAAEHCRSCRSSNWARHSDSRRRGVVAATPWWHVVPGASWRSPRGPGSDVTNLPDHPVTQVSHRDAVAYADWAGGRLPTEQEWEWAARGGLVQQPFPWGAEREPDDQPRMNTFVGEFPQPTGPVGTVTVRSFAPNAFGLFNTTGNVWEWTASPFSDWDRRPVFRGGSYLCHDSYCRRYRTSARTANTPDTALGHTGFRIAADG